MYGSKSFKTCEEYKQGSAVLQGTINIPKWIEGKYWNVDTVFDAKPKNISLKLYYYLDKKCTIIDSAIKKKQTFIQKLTAYKKSLIYGIVTGKKEV